MDKKIPDNKGLKDALEKGIEGKALPLSATTVFTAAERIKAHIEQGYELLPADVEYHFDLAIAFGIISNPVFQGEDRHQTNLVQRLTYQFGKKYNPYTILTDVQFVFGNFYQIDKKFRRHIQEQRLNTVLKKAQVQKNLQLELDILKELNRLHSLQDQNDPEEIKVKKLPRRKRTSNPKVFAADD